MRKHSLPVVIGTVVFEEREMTTNGITTQIVTINVNTIIDISTYVLVTVLQREIFLVLCSILLTVLFD